MTPPTPYAVLGIQNSRGSTPKTSRTVPAIRLLTNGLCASNISATIPPSASNDLVLCRLSFRVHVVIQARVCHSSCRVRVKEAKRDDIVSLLGCLKKRSRVIVDNLYCGRAVRLFWVIGAAQVNNCWINFHRGYLFNQVPQCAKALCGFGCSRNGISY